MKFTIFEKFLNLICEKKEKKLCKKAIRFGKRIDRKEKSSLISIAIDTVMEIMKAYSRNENARYIGIVGQARIASIIATPKEI